MDLTSLIIGIISGVITIIECSFKLIKHYLFNINLKRHIQLDQESHQQKIQNDQEFCHLVSNMINNQY